MPSSETVSHVSMYRQYTQSRVNNSSDGCKLNMEPRITPLDQNSGAIRRECVANNHTENTQHASADIHREMESRDNFFLNGDTFDEDQEMLKPKPGNKVLRRTKSLYGASPNVKFGPKASIMKTQSNVLTITDPASQRLTWYKAPLSVLIIKKIHDDSVIPPFIELVQWLVKDKQMVVWVERKVLQDPFLCKQQQFDGFRHEVHTFQEETDDLKDKVDLIITLGGDGTLLYASNLFQESVPPVMAFHFGSLGFLSPFDFTDFKTKVSQVLSGNVPLCLRTRLKCSVCKRGAECENSPTSNYSIKHVESRQHLLVLNEVVVDRGPSAYIGNVDLYIEHKYITSVQGDGLIISTPTGSTAYAAAAGASMVHPNVPAIVIAPICAHSLSFRPVVVPAGVEIKLKVNEEARNRAWISFDGRNRMALDKGDTLRISTSIFPLPSICAGDQMSDWFDSLSSCLHWNVRKAQKPLHTVNSDDSVTDYNSNESTNGHLNQSSS